MLGSENRGEAQHLVARLVRGQRARAVVAAAAACVASRSLRGKRPGAALYPGRGVSSVGRSSAERRPRRLRCSARCRGRQLGWWRLEEERRCWAGGGWNGVGRVCVGVAARARVATASTAAALGAGGMAGRRRVGRGGGGWRGGMARQGWQEASNTPANAAAEIARQPPSRPSLELEAAKQQVEMLA